MGSQCRTRPARSSASRPPLSTCCGAATLADYVLVEADGSRGRSLKAFGPDEPQVPSVTTTIVQVAGADVLGQPLREEYVHRAAPLAAAARRSVRAPSMTPSLVRGRPEGPAVAAAPRLARGAPVVLVNKVEGDAVLAAASATAALLRAPLEDAAVPAPSVAPGGDAPATAVPDRVVSRACRRDVSRGRRPRRRRERVGRRRGGRPPSRPSSWRRDARSRMGSQKLLLPLAGRPLVQWSVDAALASRAQETVVVVGHEAPDGRGGSGRPTRAHPDQRGVRGWHEHLSAGRDRGGAGRCEAIVVLLADQPFVTPALIDLLIERFAATGAPIVRPAVEGRPDAPRAAERGALPRDPARARATSAVARWSPGISSEVMPGAAGRRLT